MLCFAVLPAAAFVGRGVGQPRQRRVATPVVAQQQLDADAQALLDEVGGDAAKARTSYIGYTLAYIKDEMPELYEKIRDDPKDEDAHAALVDALVVHDGFEVRDVEEHGAPAARRLSGDLAHEYLGAFVADADTEFREPSYEPITVN